MIFENKQLNRMLNALLKNNKFAKQYFTQFIKSLPEDTLSVLHDCQNRELDGEDWEINTYYAPNEILIEIYYNNQTLRLEFCPISHELLSKIPIDNENDIFFNEGENFIDSPAFFNIVYNPDVEKFDDYDALDYGYYIVKKQEKNGGLGYYLLSQSLDDAGIYCSKIDVEDFIIDPAESEFNEARHVDPENSTSQPVPEDNVHTIYTSPRRAPHPRHLNF